MLIPFKWPLRGMIADPSQSGKSTLVAELIKHRDESIQPPPERILFFKKYPSSVPPSIQHLVEYRENLPTEDDLLNQSKQLSSFSLIYKMNLSTLHKLLKLIKLEDIKISQF